MALKTGRVRRKSIAATGRPRRTGGRASIPLRSKNVSPGRGGHPNVYSGPTPPWEGQDERPGCGGRPRGARSGNHRCAGRGGGGGLRGEEPAASEYRASHGGGPKLWRNRRPRGAERVRVPDQAIRRGAQGDSPVGQPRERPPGKVVLPVHARSGGLLSRPDAVQGS